MSPISDRIVSVLGVWPPGRLVLARNVPEHAKRGRLNVAGCRWDKALCQQHLDNLKRSDRGAWAMMNALIEESEDRGLPIDQHGDGYAAPVGERVKPTEFRGRPTPWLGELRVEERTPRRRSALGNTAHHRLYFGEPNDPDDLVMALLLDSKRGRDPLALIKQTKAMVNAMWALMKWCEGRDPATGWREWDWSVYR